MEAAVEAGGLLAEGAEEAELVQRRRPQLVDEAADVRDHVLRLVPEAYELLVDGGGVAFDEGGGRVQLERDSGERRAEAVVEVTPETPPFFLAGGDDSFARALQGKGERDCVGGDAGLAGEVAEQLPVGR